MRRILACLLALLLLAGCAADAGTTPQETVTTTTAPKPQPIVETSRATVLAVGDLLMHIPVINCGRTADGYNYDKLFAYAKDHITAADFAVANLETTLAGTENGRKYTGYPRFNCPEAIVDAAKAAGFDMLLTANNHCNDTGADGITRTLEQVKARDVLTLGTTSAADEPDYLVQEINGIRVGMVCYTYGTINDSTGQKAVNGLPIHKSLTEQVNVFDYRNLDRFYREMETLIAAMRAEGAEAITLFIHWGNEYQTKQNSTQTKMAQVLCDLGVDVIVGGHPHVLQGAELLTSTADPTHTTVCAYSLGNILSNQRRERMNLNTGHTEDGALFTFTFVKYSNGKVFVEQAELLPTWLHMHTNENGKTYDILPLDDTLADWKTTFRIGDTYYQRAMSSYDRSQAVFGEGMSAIQAFLAEQNAARAKEYANPTP